MRRTPNAEDDTVCRAPEILTERLRLRGHRPDDLDARSAITADSEVCRFTGGTLQSREDNWARIQRYAGQWVLDGFGLFAVEDRARGCFVGEVGLGRFGRGLGADFDAAPEAAWMLAPDLHGRGFAREAVTAALAWHEGRFGPSRTVCCIADENAPSLALAVRLGFRPFRNAAYRDRPAILLERLPFDAEAG